MGCLGGLTRFWGVGGARAQSEGDRAKRPFSGAVHAYELRKLLHLLGKNEKECSLRTEADSS